MIPGTTSYSNARLPRGEDALQRRRGCCRTATGSPQTRNAAAVVVAQLVARASAPTARPAAGARPRPPGRRPPRCGRAAGREPRTIRYVGCSTKRSQICCRSRVRSWVSAPLSTTKKTSTWLSALIACTVRWSGSPAPIPMTSTRLTVAAPGRERPSTGGCRGTRGGRGPPRRR